ncbi:MAG: hypothetical protein MPW13_02725 [Candidatus Manganitrophus sp.]|nr:hypothetical protein [Candidatus Manganitrophus sp.]
MNTYKPQLDQYSIQILLDLLNKAGSEGVDVVYYRIQHEDQRDLLDKLETEEYLKKENEKYWVTLNGLIVMKDQQYAKDLLERCEKIFSVLRNHYKAKPKDNIKVIDIAYTTGLTFNQTIECLGYMKQAWFWSGWSNDVQDVAVAFVKPSEKILDHKTFKEVAIELKRLRDRRHESITPITFSAKNKKIRNAEPLVHDEHLNLHPKIAEASLSLFETQHYRDAILNSFIAVFDYIRKRTGLDLDGEDLVNNVFSLNKPLFKA